MQRIIAFLMMLYHWITTLLRVQVQGLKDDPRRWDQKLGLIPNALSLIRLFYGLKLVLRDLPEALDEDKELGLLGHIRPTDFVAIKLGFIFVTDYVDGMSARLLKAETAFGANLDTFVDKIVIILLLVVLRKRKLLPWGTTVMFIILGREGLMMFAKPYVKKKYAADMKVKQSGRVKMFAQCVAIIMLVSTRTRGSAADFAIAAATTLTATSLADYFEEFRLIAAK